jgi:hypothetical protein
MHSPHWWLPRMLSVVQRQGVFPTTSTSPVVRPTIVWRKLSLVYCKIISLR